MSLRGLSTDKLKNFLITLDANYGLSIRPSPTTVNNFWVLFCIVELTWALLGIWSNVWVIFHMHWLLEKLFSVQPVFAKNCRQTETERWTDIKGDIQGRI